MKKMISLFCFAILTSGCSVYSVDSRETTMNIYRPKSSIDQIVYLKQVNRRHEVIGYATVTTQRRQHLEDILTKMKKEAAVMGGDAITGIEIEAAGSWKKLPLQKFIGNGYVHARFRGSVIAFQ